MTPRARNLVQDNLLNNVPCIADADYSFDETGILGFGPDTSSQGNNQTVRAATHLRVVRLASLLLSRCVCSPCSLIRISRHYYGTHLAHT